MNQGDQPAFPAEDHRNGMQYGGLTKREYFAIMAMQGLIMSNYSNAECNASEAIRHADELLKQLES